MTTDIVAAETARPLGYVCHRAPGPIPLTGRGDAPAWAAAAWTTDFVDIEGDRRPAPRYRTRARMLHDDDFLYIHAEMEEPHVWASITRRNAVIFHDNDFEVFLDPDGDNQEYYELEVNALNTPWQLSLPAPYRTGASPRDPDEIDGLRTAVHVDGTLNDPSDVDRGWSVEIAIPFAGLDRFCRGGRACPPRDGDQWRINFSRVQWRHEVVDGTYRKIEGVPEDNWVWSPQGVVDMHRPATWGVLQFSGVAAGDGDVPLREDPHHDARNLLMSVWERQRARDTPTDSAAELGLAAAVEIAVVDDGAWQAIVPSGDVRLRVDQRARLTVT